MKAKISKRLLGSYVLLHTTVVLLIGVQFSRPGDPCLSAVAARYVDQVLPHKKLPFEQRMIRGLKARCVSLLAYPVFATADVVVLFPKAMGEYGASWLASGPAATRLEEAARVDLGWATSSLVGLVSTPAGVISADFVTRHFVPDGSESGVIEAAGHFYQAKGEPIFPRSVESIQRLVRYARDNDRRVTVIGTKMSHGRQCLPNDPEDVVLNLKHLNGITVNREQKSVVAQAGATWQQIQAIINPYGLSVQVMQASNIFSVGGSLSVNCHGWDHRAGTVAETVRRLAIVDSEGQLRNITPDDEEFRLVMGGYGLFGIIVEAELALTDNTALIDQGEVVPVDEYTRYFRDRVLPNDAIEMHLYRLSLNPDALLAEGVAQNYVRDPSQPGAIVSDLRDEDARGKRAERVSVHTARKFKLFRKGYWEKEKARIQQPSPTTRNGEMRAPIRAMLNHSSHDAEWLQEFFLPEEELSPFLTELGKLLMQYNVCLLNASVRFVKQDPHALLGYATEGDRFAVVLCFNQPLEAVEVDHTQEWVRRAIDLALRHKGSYYLPYQHFASQEQFQRAYPAFERFLSAKKTFDPAGVFSNQFFELHRTLPPQQPSAHIHDAADAFHHVFADPMKRREFRKFFRNIFLNLDEDAFMRLADRVLAKEDSHDSIYQTLEKEIGEAQYNSVKGGWRSLRALMGQRKAVTSQVKELMGAGTPVNGYLEIGFPGRMVRAIRSTVNLTGRSYVVHTNEALGDYLQCGFPRPYDAFFPLEDYRPLTQSVDAESLDLVSCFIGLHHCPEEKLDLFVQSIADLLRPGGSFLLRDHDVDSDDIMAMATLAHTSFNLGTGVTWRGEIPGQDEATETRNFRSLAYWDEVLKRHGLVRNPNQLPLIRAGDPTKNSLVRYVKVVSEQRRQQDEAEAALYSQEATRRQLQTFMTGVEWYSVRMARDYADYIEHTPFYMYPYFSHIRAFWKTFALSWSEACHYHSRWDIVTSDYFLMNAFIAGFHTVEFAIKGVVSAPVAAFYQTDANLEPETISLVVADYGQRLANFEERGVHVRQTTDGEMVHIEAPRYRKFRDLLVDMADSGIEVVNIAGQKRIQVQCTLPSDQSHLCENLPGSRVIGECPLPSDPHHTIAYLNVEVRKLHHVLPELRARGVDIYYIHDF